MAYSLFLFIRDIADGDVVAWIDAQLGPVNPRSPDRLACHAQGHHRAAAQHLWRCRQGVGVALADLLLSAGQQRPLWREVGATWWRSTPWCTISCIEPESCGGWAPSIPTASAATGPADALAFSVCLPRTSTLASSIRPSRQTFPRFVQSAIWRYCAENGLDICNGNRIDDESRCDNGHCQLFRRCDRIALRNERKKIA